MVKVVSARREGVKGFRDRILNKRVLQSYRRAGGRK